MQKLEHRALGNQAFVVQSTHNFVVNEGSAALVHHLRLLLRVEVLRYQTDDTDKLSLPILKPRRPFFDQIEQILLWEPKLSLDLLEPRLGCVGILFVFPGAGNSAPQIIVGRLGMGPPFFGSTTFFGEVRLGAVGVTVDTVVLKRMCGIEHTLDCFASVPLLALLNIIACET